MVSDVRAVRNRSRPIETDIGRRDSTPGASTQFSLIQSRHFRGTVRHLGLPVPRGCHGLAIERLQGFSRNVRREMAIAHCHVHRGVAEQLLDDLERHSAHGQMRGEAVPEHMPADASQSCQLAGAPQRLLALRLHQHLAVLVAEHERAAKMPLLFERPQRVIARGTDAEVLVLVKKRRNFGR
jgi:hypothetical protein